MKESTDRSSRSHTAPSARPTTDAVERILSGKAHLSIAMLPGVLLQEFASGKCGAKGLSTGKTRFEPGAGIPYHKHAASEAVVILAGEASLAVEGRTYQLRPFDCVHIPAGVAHEVRNLSGQVDLIAHTSFATDAPSREFVENNFILVDRALENPVNGDPEHIVRFTTAPRYELAGSTWFCDLFAGRYGAVGICGGYGEFSPGSSLPCHFHEYDESITIVKGEAICEVAGRRHCLSNYDTAFVPQRRPHRFLNESSMPMAMVWVYGGSEPERTIVDCKYCTGTLQWNKI